MPNMVDSKVVELKFDKSKFESNAQSALDLLQKLNSTINNMDSADGLSGLSKALKGIDEHSFSNLANSADSVKVKIGALDTAIKRVVENLTDLATSKVFGKLAGMASMVIDPLVHGGEKRALNIEQAKFQIEGLGKSWDKPVKLTKAAVTKLTDDEKRLLNGTKKTTDSIKEDVLYAVNKTAYGLDAAARVAAQFAASGVEMGDDMRASLRAISGVAAMTGSSYEDIGRIFVTIAGNGRMMGEQLLQLSGRGINAAATLRDYWNRSSGSIERFRDLYNSFKKKTDEPLVKGAKVTEKNIRTLVTNGGLQFKTFRNAMDWAFGKHAQDANKTYAGSLSNLKAALSRIGADVAAAKFKRLRDINNALIPAIDGVHEALAPIIKLLNNVKGKHKRTLVNFIHGVTEGVQEFNSAGGGDAIAKSLRNIRKAAKAVKEPVIEAFKAIFPRSFTNLAKTIGGGLAGMAKSLETFTSKLIISEATQEKIKKTSMIVFKQLKKGFDGIVALTMPYIKRLQSWAMPIIVRVRKEIQKNLGSMGKDIRQWAKDVQLVEKVEAILRKGADRIKHEFSRIAGYLAETLKNTKTQKIFEVLADSFKKTKLFELLTKLGDKLAEIKNAFIDAINSFSVEGLASKVKTSVYDMWKIIVEYVKSLDIVGQLSKLMKSVLRAIANFDFRGALKTLVEAAKSAGKVVQSVVQIVRKALKPKGNKDNANSVNAVAVSLESATGKIRAVVSILSKYLGVAGAKLMTFSKIAYEFAKGNAKHLSLDQVIDQLKGIVIISAIERITKSVEALSAVPRSLAGALNNVSKSLKTFNKGIKINAILRISIAIGILAAALIGLSFVPFDKLKKAGIVLGALAAGLLVFTAALTKMFSMLDPKKAAAITAIFGAFLVSVGIGLASAAIGIGILVASLEVLIHVIKQYAALSEDVFNKGFAKISAIIGSLVEYLFGVFFVGKKGKSVAISLLALVASLYLLEKVLRMYAKLDERTFKTGSERIGKIIKDIRKFLFTAVMSPGFGIKEAGVGILILSLTLFLRGIGSVLRDLASISEADMKKGQDALKSIMRMLEGFFAVMAFALGGANFGRYGQLSTGGATFLNLIGLSVSLLSLVQMLQGLVGVIGALGDMDKAALTQGMTAMTVAITEIAAFIGAISFVTKGDAKVVSALGAFVTSMIAVAGAILVLGNMEWKAAARGVTFMGAAMFALGYAVKSAAGVMGKVDKKGLTVFIGTALLMVAIGYELMVLSKVPWQQMTATGGAMAGCMIAFGTAMKLVATELRAISKNKRGFVQFLSIVVVMGIIAGILYLLSKRPWKQMAAAGGAMTACMLTFAGAIAVCSRAAKTAAKKVIFLVAMAGGLVALVAAFAALQKFTGIKMASLMGSLAALAIGLGALGAVFGAIGKLGATGPAITALLAFVGAITGVAVALGALAMKIKPMEKALRKGIEVASLLGEFIGSFFGKIVGSFVNTSGINKFAKYISKFGESIEPFLDLCAGADKSMASGAKYIASAVKSMIWTSMLSGFNGSNSNLREFGKELRGFSNAIEPFLVVAATTDKDAARGAKIIAESLWAMLKSNVLTNLLGDDANKLSKFGKALSTFAANVLGFMMIAETVRPGAVKGARIIHDAVASMLGSSVETGILATSGNTTRLISFGETLSTFAKNAKPFFRIASRQDGSSVKGARIMHDAIASMLGSSVETGILATFSNTTKLVSFGETLSLFAKNSKPFFRMASRQDGSSVKGARIMHDAIASMLGSSVETGILATFGNTTSLASFGETLSTFAKNSKPFFRVASRQDGSSVKGARIMHDAIASMLGSSVETGLFANFDNTTKLISFGETLSTFAKNAKPFFRIASRQDESSINGARIMHDSIASMLGSSVETGIFGNIDNTMSLVSFGETLSAFAKNSKPFFKMASRQDESSINGARIMHDAIASMLGSSVESGIFANFDNTTSLVSFGETLSTFAKNTKPFFRIASRQDESSIKGARIMHDAIASMLGSSVETGLFANIDNTTRLISFGETISTFAKNAKPFFRIASRQDESSIKGARIMHDAIASMLGSTVEAGIFNNFGNATRLISFGETLSTFAKNARPFFTMASNQDGTAVRGARVMHDAIASMLGSSIETGIFGNFSNATSLISFGETLTKFAKSIEGFLVIASNTPTNARTGVETMTSAVKQLIAADIWSKANNFLGGSSIVEIGRQIGKFAENAAAFFNVLRTLKTGNPAEFSKLVSAIKNLQAINTESLDPKKLEKLGTTLNDFAFNAGTFFMQINNLKLDAGDAMTSVVRTIQSLVAVAPLLNDADKLPKLGQDLSEFAWNAAAFFSTVSTITEDSGNGIKATADAVKELTGINLDSDSIHNIYTLETALSNLAESVRKFADKTAEMDTSGIEKAVSIVRRLASIEIPVSGGIFTWYKDTSLSKFGENLIPLATGLNSMSTKLSNFEPEKVKQAISCVAKLAKISIPETGGLKMLWSDKSFRSFGDNMKPLADGLSSLSKKLSSFKPKKVRQAVECIQMLSAINLPTSGGAKALFDNKTFEKFGESLEAMAPHLQAFSDSVASVNTNKIGAVAKSLQKFGEIKLNSGKLDKFSASIQKLGTRYSKAVSKLSNSSGVDAAITNMKKLAGIGDIVKGKGNSLDSFSKSLKSAATKGVKGFISAFRNGYKSAKSVSTTFVSKAKAPFKGIYTAFHTSGSNAGKGFVNGLAEWEDDVISTARRIGKAAHDALKKATKEGSPSKLTYQTGKFFDMGFINGMRALARSVYHASYDVGTSAIDGISDSLEINSPSKAMYRIAKYAIEGFEKGIKESNASKWTREYADEAMRQMMESVKGFERIGEKLGVTVTGAMAASWVALYEASDKYAEDMSKLKEGSKNLADSFRKLTTAIKNAAKVAKKAHVSISKLFNKKTISLIDSDPEKGFDKVVAGVEKMLKTIRKKLGNKKFNKLLGKDFFKKLTDSPAAAITKLSNLLGKLGKNKSVSKYVKVLKTIVPVLKKIINAEKDLKQTGDDVLESMTAVIQEFRDSAVNMLKDITSVSNITLPIEIDFTGKTEAEDDRTNAINDLINEYTETRTELEAKRAELDKAIAAYNDTAEQDINAPDYKVGRSALLKQEVIDTQKEYDDLESSLNDILKQLEDLGAVDVTVDVNGNVNYNEDLSKYWESEKEKYFKNIESQLDSYDEYYSELAKLTERFTSLFSKSLGGDAEKTSSRLTFIAEQFKNYLIGLGYSEVDAIKVINKMSDEELQRAIGDYQRYVSMNTTEALKAYKDRVTNAKKFYSNMLLLAKQGLSSEAYKELLNMGPDAAAGIVAGLVEGGEEAIDEFDNILFDREAAAEEAGRLAGEGYAMTFEKAVSEASKDAAEAASSVTEDAAKATQDALNDVVTKTKTITARLSSEATSIGAKSSLFETAGEAMMGGLVSGIINTSGDAVNAATAVATQAYESVKTELEINSPSKKFIDIGMYLMMGLAKGIRDNITEVMMAEDQVAKAISSASELLDTDVESHPVISPVIDLTQARAEARKVAGLFGAESVELAASVSGYTEKRRNIQNGSTTNNNKYDNSTTTQNNNFYISGEDPKAIADKVEQILQKKVNRRNAVWA